MTESPYLAGILLNIVLSILIVFYTVLAIKGIIRNNQGAYQPTKDNTTTPPKREGNKYHKWNQQLNDKYKQ